MDATETALWERYLASRTDECRNALVERYWGWACDLAYQVSCKLFNDGTWDLGDLENWGAQGLIHAVERFEPGRKLAFTTFATQRVRGAIMDGIREIDPAPRLMRSRQKKGLGTVPTQTSLNVPIGLTDDGSPRFHDMLDRSIQLEMPGIKEWWAEAMRSLDKRERLLMLCFYREGLTMKQVGETLGCSESRISQMHSMIVARLKRRLGPKLWMRGGRGDAEPAATV